MVYSFDEAGDEVERVADIAHEAMGVACRGCGRRIVLRFNGGELDARECCGYRYSTEHVRIDFVVTKRP
jgi:hypothetical protein